MTTLAPGAECPPFDLPDADGGSATLASLAGHPFVLYLYPKDDTSGCTLEAVEFTALIDRFEAIGVPVLGVSPDPVKAHCKFRDKHGLRVRLLSDENKGFLEACGVWVGKSMYGRSYMGVERTTALVDAAGKVAEVWTKVKVPGHAEAVLAAAGELADRAS